VIFSSDFFVLALVVDIRTRDNEAACQYKISIDIHGEENCINTFFNKSKWKKNMKFRQVLVGKRILLETKFQELEIGFFVK